VKHSHATAANNAESQRRAISASDCSTTGMGLPSTYVIRISGVRDPFVCADHEAEPCGGITMIANTNVDDAGEC
jgi:hypothetical protein